MNGSGYGDISTVVQSDTLGSGVKRFKHRFVWAHFTIIYNLCSVDHSTVYDKIFKESNNNCTVIESCVNENSFVVPSLVTILKPVILFLLMFLLIYFNVVLFILMFLSVSFALKECFYEM